MKKFQIILIAIMTTFPTARADERHDRTVQALYQECKGTPAQQTACLNFLRGVASTMMFLGDVSKQEAVPKDTKTFLDGSGICPAAAISTGQIQRIFVNWADQNPKQWRSPEIWGVMSALVDAWPCK